MKTTLHVAALSAALLLSTASFAEDAKSPVSITLDNYAVYDFATATLATGHEIAAVLEVTAGEVTLGAELWLGLTGDLAAGTIVLEAPELILSAESETLGRIEVLDADGALDAACVMPAPGSTHFGEEDLMTFGTCGGYSDGAVVSYRTPSIGGFFIYASAMSDLKNVIDVGEVDTAASAALGYEGELAGGATLTASLGVDHALSLKGGAVPGAPLPTTVQAGAEVGWDGWTVGAAGQYEAFSTAGGDRWAAGLGVSRVVVENLTVTGEVAVGRYEDMGAPMQEVSFGATAEYAIIPEKVLVDAVVNVVHRTGSGIDEVVSAAGAGLSVAF